MKYFLALSILFICMFYSCIPDEEVYTEADATLRFSIDTLRFDTVFTELGSATRYIRIYNDYDKDIQISEIKLEEGNRSKFRINVDGLPGAAQDIEVPAKDSIYVFAEVTIDPDAPLSISPFVVEEKISFTTNGNTQTVVLEAWGQNANYIPNRTANGTVTGLQCNGGEIIWDDPKPYVIFGILVIDDCKLVLPEGADIYVHGGLEYVFDSTELVRQYYNDGRIITTGSGSIEVRGTPDNPVRIQGDRLETSFQEVAGQWYGIVLGVGSRGNEFEHLILKNSALGIAVDSTGELKIKNSQIYNTSSHALFGIHSSIEAENCLFYNNASTSIRMTYGGAYKYDYCTIYSDGEGSASAMSLSNFICLNSDCSIARFNAADLQVRNCILAGSGKDELALIEADNAPFTYRFENTALVLDELLDEDRYPDFIEDCENCILLNRNDNLFVDASENDFHLDTLSVVEEKATPIMDILTDLEGFTRDNDRPDIGAYEYQY